MSNRQLLKWLPIKPSAQDLEFLKFQEEMSRQIYQVFALTPAELGIVDNTNVEELESARVAFEKHIERIVVDVIDKGAHEEINLFASVSSKPA